MSALVFRRVGGLEEASQLQTKGIKVFRRVGGLEAFQ